MSRSFPLGPRPGSQRPARVPRRFGPRLTVLEDRTVPSTFTVKNLDDSGPDSLRAAVAAADASPGADTIRFLGGLHGTITLASELPITTDLTIDGPGANQLTVSGNGVTRVFDVSAGAVTIDRLTISGGLADSGAINGSFGGGIYHASGTLTLSDAVFAANEANGSAADDIGWGGGIFNAAGATLSVTNGTFTDNVAVGSARGRGGAILNDGTAA